MELLFVGLLCVVASIAPVAATSSGVIFLCDAHANYGCGQWGMSNGKLDHTKCLDANPGQMDWASRPVRSDKYSVRSGTGTDRTADKKTYTPGALMLVYLDVLHPDWKYRGLLIHAVNSQNVTVGSWEHPATENALFWSPPQCPKATLHAFGEEKPFRVRLWFKAPPAGTGGITFRTLLKRGPANTGEFYYPNKGFGDLTLAENGGAVTAAAQPGSSFTASGSGTRGAAGGSGSGSGPTWHISAVGESCDILCKKRRSFCNAGALAAVDSAAALQAAVGNTTACALPILSDCSSVSPTMGSDGTCYYHDPTTCSPSSANAAATAAAPTSSTTAQAPTAAQPPSCYTTGQSAQNGQRFCACGAGSSLSASRALTGAALLFSTAALGGGGRGSLSLLLLVLLCSLALNAVPAQAHNWMFTPARARQQASTFKPCRGRTNTDTHAQVGPGQDVVVKWATGHSRPSYWTVVAGANTTWMRYANFSAMVDDYIAQAPAGSNTAQTPKYQRYHGPRASSPLAWYDSGGVVNGKPLYSGRVSSSSPNWLTHPDVPTGALYQYTADRIAGDRRVSYRSAKYPWLLAAAKYQHLYHLPSDYDAVRISLPPWAKPGHYVVGWKWSGYYDCTDVDLFATPVANVYGKNNGGFVYDKIDHCQYLKPKQIMTQCRDATVSAAACQADLEVATASSRWNQRSAGVNVVPAHNPSTVLFPNTPVNIPLLNKTCANSALTRVSGTDSHYPVDWAAWRSTMTVTAGVRCLDSFGMTTTLRQAIARCNNPGCTGITVAAASDVAVQTGTHYFRICSSMRTGPRSGWRVFFKTPPAAVPPLTTAPFTASVSFQPAGLAVNVPSGWYTDTGALYGASTQTPSLDMGWNCAPVMRSNSAVSPATATSTYVDRVQNCPDGSAMTWQMAVPNGVYTVSSVVGSGSATRTHGCIIENVRLSFFNTGTSGDTQTVQVVVSDGKLTLQGMDSSGTCQYINTLTLNQTGLSLPPVWLPAATNPWVQRQLPAHTRIGLVTINTAGLRTRGYDCRRGLLYKGNFCQQGLPSPPFTNTYSWSMGRYALEGQANVGAVVRVSNTSCSGAAVCPGAICSTVTDVLDCPGDRGRSSCAPQVDCRGHVGLYVSVQLPGSGRVLDITSWSTNTLDLLPPRLPRHGMVCYGVEPRVQTSTVPEYVVTTDPDDPVFYGTCYARKRNITWLATGKQQQAAPRWRYDGACLDCASFWANQRPNVTFASPRWTLDPRCLNCDRASLSAAANADAWPLGSTPAPHPPSAAASKTVLGVAAAAVVVAGVVAILVERRRRGPNAAADRAAVRLSASAQSSFNSAAGSSSAAAASPVKTATAATPAAVEMSTPSAPVAAAAPAAAALPAPWQAVADPASGQTYYHNTATGVTTWTKPV